MFFLFGVVGLVVVSLSLAETPELARLVLISGGVPLFLSAGAASLEVSAVLEGSRLVILFAWSLVLFLQRVSDNKKSGLFWGRSFRGGVWISN